MRKRPAAALKRPAAVSKRPSSLPRKKPATKRIEFLDPHFHIWDVSATTATGHDGTKLFAPEGKELYDRMSYEAAFHTASLFEHVPGVFVEAMSVCHIDCSGGEFSEQCVKEAKFVEAELSEKGYGLVLSCALEQPDVQETLAKLAAFKGARGIRQILNSKPDWPRNIRLGDLLDSEQWREGFAQLHKFNLSFDMQLNPHQFAKAASFLAGHPETTVIIDHLGTPTMEDLTTNADQYWSGLEALAKLPNTFIKISMLCYADKEWDKNTTVTSAVHRVIATFGSSRCMYASNDPVDAKDGWPPPRLLKAFQKLAASFSDAQQLDLFGGSARRAYRL